MYYPAVFEGMEIYSRVFLGQDTEKVFVSQGSIHNKWLDPLCRDDYRCALQCIPYKLLINWYPVTLMRLINIAQTIVIVDHSVDGHIFC